MNIIQHKDPKAQAKQNEKQDERYRLLGSVGKGRTADILSCFDKSLNRIVALKQLRPEFAADEKKVAGFLNETRLASFLDHPCVVTVYDTFSSENKTACYTMKLVSGNSLRYELSKKTRGQLLAIFTKLCEALAYVHDKGVVHLDLNPENIMIGQYGEVMIADWGNARIYDKKPYMDYLKLVRDAPPPPDIGNDIPVPAIAWYMSPEQSAANPDAIAPTSDIFSMGVILYEMMAGKVPFYAPDIKQLVDQIQRGTPRLLHEICPEIPRMLSLICAKMLEKDPFQRYHSFHEVLRHLDQFQNSGQAFSTQKLNPGDIFIQEGDHGDYAFMVTAGSVEVSRTVDGVKKVLSVLGPGEIVGELAIFSNEPRSATIMALEPTTIRIMDRPSVEQEMQKLSPWVQQMISALSKRFIKLNEQLIR